MRPGLLLAWMVPVLAACQSKEGPLTFTAGSEGSSGPASAERCVPLARLIDSLGLDARTMRLRVNKSDRRMSVYVNDTVRRIFHCVLGEHPEGDKMMQGDRRTPEGTFTFRSKRRPHQWHAFIWIDYPNAESRRRFEARRRNGDIPANAEIGGEVGIHGVPEGRDHWIDDGSDWTWGCIALKNSDLDEIYPYVIPWRTQLTIEP